MMTANPNPTGPDRRVTWLHAQSLALIAITMSLSACEVGMFLGYGLPANEACRDVAALPGEPIRSECLDFLDSAVGPD
jgi:hypothetical protein